MQGCVHTCALSSIAYFFPYQVHHEGNPENALVTFNSHSEANAAYRSTEAVLNNRFIKLFWHNPQVQQDVAKLDH